MNEPTEHEMSIALAKFAGWECNPSSFGGFYIDRPLREGEEESYSKTRIDLFGDDTPELVWLKLPNLFSDKCRNRHREGAEQRRLVLELRYDLFNHESLKGQDVFIESRWNKDFYTCTIEDECEAEGPTRTYAFLKSLYLWITK